MTTTTPDTVTIPVPEAARPSPRVRFAVAFLVGLIAAMAVGVGALYAYDQQYTGRVLPGVRIGDVDLSGLTAASAAERLRDVYGSLGEGSVTITSPLGDRTISFADIGRGPDIDAMVTEALGVGRNGNAVDRAIANTRTAVRGVSLTPRVAVDADALANEVLDFADSLARQPIDAFVAVVDTTKFTVVPAVEGRLTDPAVPVKAALADLGELDAPADLRYELPVRVVEPTVTTDEAAQAKTDAERIAAPIRLALDGKKETITTTRLRGWLSFAPTVDGGYGVSIDTTKLDGVLKVLAKRIDEAPVNASFTTSGGRITGVTPSKQGYKVNLAATRAQVQALLDARMAGATTSTIEPSVTQIQPALTTAEAKAARPKMRKISQWTTYFPIGEKNGFGANIWIPARLINGYVVAPGATFDFWGAVGTVSRAKGFRQGGAIINGRTEPQGALAGGICSCSTTLFNAAMRAGYDMEARRNHFYYIDRYPLGLDATVFISASGSKQTMSFVNDTQYPILIRGYGYRNGSRGYVKFEIYSVPNGRKVVIGTPTVRNVRYATDTVQYTSSLPAGYRKRIEYPVDGKDVWRTVSVYQKGKLLRRVTYYSHYARITGITLVGR
ncbi:MAG TPA: VanW family protein [Candidatus Limnocylindrales bacterium]|jgi:vancomycin resistance protein YoaR|nr:VanW family protein [Candidatus Limnocylindrales bacterium]